MNLPIVESLEAIHTILDAEEAKKFFTVGNVI